MDKNSDYSYKISYNPLWKLLIDKGISKPKLREMTGIAASTMTKMQKNEYVSLEVVIRICTALQCNIPDVIEIRNDMNKKET